MFAKLAKHSARHAARSILGAGLYEKIQFRRHTGYPLDIDDPKTWNEKLTVRKLDRSFNDALILQDKYASRKLVEDRVGAEFLTQVYDITDDPEAIDSRPTRATRPDSRQRISFPPRPAGACAPRNP